MTLKNVTLSIMTHSITKKTVTLNITMKNDALNVIKQDCHTQHNH
jgi:hypothetical protein